jgi:hypothetical protein
MNSVYRVSVMLSNGHAQSAMLQRQVGTRADGGWPIWENVKELHIDENGNVQLSGELSDAILKGVDQIIDICMNDLIT